MFVKVKSASFSTKITVVIYANIIIFILNILWFRKYKILSILVPESLLDS